MLRGSISDISPNLRHGLMQIVLVALLAGTLGLAVLVRNHRLHLLHVKLEAPVQAGPFNVRWPGGWEMRATQNGAILLEPSDGDSEGKRRLEIWQVASVGFVSPLELLVRLDQLDARDAAVLPTLQGEEAGGLKPIRIAGWPGVSVSLTRQYPAGRNQPPVFRKQTFACTVLPSGDAILLRLEGRGLTDVSDEHVIRRVAESLTLIDKPQVERGGGEFPLGDEINLTLPESLATFASTEPFRIGRIFIPNRNPDWLGVELVPCLVEDQPDSAAAFLSLLHLRDPFSRWTKPEKLDDHTWTSQRETQAGGAFPARAFLRTDSGGHALLAEFRWVSSQSPASQEGIVETLWPAITGQIHFPGSANLNRLVEAGKSAIRSLPADAVEVLNTRPEERWEWYHESTPKSSSAVFRFDASQTYITGDVEFDRSPPLAQSGWESRRWRLWRDWSRYVNQVTRTTAGMAISYETRVEANQIRMTVRTGPDTISTADAPRSPLYVPGAVLPLVLGRLKPEPMVLMTDAIPSPLTGSFTGLLTLRLEPATDLLKPSPDGEGPMTSWSVRVNGSGQSSRWYFDRNKRLESISFAGKAHFHRVESEGASIPTSQPTTVPSSQPIMVPEP